MLTYGPDVDNKLCWNVDKKYFKSRCIYRQWPSNLPLLDVINQHNFVKRYMVQKVQYQYTVPTSVILINVLLTSVSANYLTSVNETYGKSYTCWFPWWFINLSLSLVRTQWFTTDWVQVISFPPRTVTKTGSYLVYPTGSLDIRNSGNN